MTGFLIIPGVQATKYKKKTESISGTLAKWLNFSQPGMNLHLQALLVSTVNYVFIEEKLKY